MARLLPALLAFSIVSTGLHYTHNFVELDRYPDDLVGGPAVRVAILISWPLLTAVGLYGLHLHRRGRFSEAYACLLAYSVLGLLTFGHFLDDTPDIAWFWQATIFTDGIAGLAIVAFVAWDYRSRRANAARAAAPTSAR